MYVYVVFKEIPLDIEIKNSCHPRKKYCHSSDVVRGAPAGLVDFVSHLQAAGMCRLIEQPSKFILAFKNRDSHRQNWKNP